MMLVPTMLTLFLAAATVAWMFRLAARSETVPPDFEAPTREEMRRHLLWRLFYVNPADPRGTVPRTYGFGYTVNFRTERNAKRFALLILATLVSAIAQALLALGCIA